MQPRNRATMSGQLVGEVIATSPTFQKRGLSERGFHALIAIAEKCHTQTRQGSVRWDHIRDCLYGASRRTAQRAVHDLLTAGVLEIVKPGFGNQYGRTCAPIYQIARHWWITTPGWRNPTKWMTTNRKCMTTNRVVDHDTQVSYLTVLLTVLLTGGATSAGYVTRRVATVNRPPTPNPSPNNKPPTPNHRATAHATCPTAQTTTAAAGIARRQHDAWKRRTVERLTALLDTIARQIDACDDCDRAGQLVYGPAFTPCPIHPNFRQPHIAAMRAKRNALRQDLAA